MKSAAFLPVALVLANLSGLAVSVLVPLLVTAGEYSIFALAWSAGQLTASVAFEWLRFGVLRYSVGADEQLAGTRRGLAWQLYVAIAAVLLLVAALCLAGAMLQPLAGLIAAVTFYAACQGAFEGRQARVRALFDNGFFSASWVMRTFLGLVLSTGLAWITGSGIMALFGLAASYPLALLVMNRARALPSLRVAWNSEQFRFLARYGLFAAFATNLSMLLPTLLRTLAAAQLGLDHAGGLLLAADLSQKAIAVVGLAVNIVLVQLSIRAAEFGSDEQIQQQAKQQISISTLFVAPATLCFYLVQDPFVQILVSPEYQDTYWQTILLCCIASGVTSFRTFAIDPLFVALGKTGRSVAGPLVALVAFLLAATIWALLGYSSAVNIAGALVFGASCGLAAATYALCGVGKITWPWTDFGKAVIAGAVMWLVAMMLPELPPGASLLTITVASGVTYLATVLLLNAAGIRAMVAGRFFSRKRS